MPNLFSSARVPLPFRAPDACCAQHARSAAPQAPSRRARLADLDANIHCSVIGTCLHTAELRKLVARHVPHLAHKDATDVEVHHTAVNLSTEGGIVAKDLNKALDTRHALAIKQFRAAGDEHALARLWREALAHGDVPGAYWALMTHPASTFDLRTVAFGDVHMLSHLVGASNRADIRRLAALEEESARLRGQNASQQARILALVMQQEAAVASLQQLQVRCDRYAAAAQSTDEVREEATRLRTAVGERDEKLARYTARRNEAEHKAASQQAEQEILHAELTAARTELATARVELRAVEHTLAHAFGDGVDKAVLPRLDGKCVLYVGGRPSCTSTLARLVAAAGGELLLHDGGIEDRHGLLATTLPRAHLVVVTIDCISHNAMQMAKQACARQQIAFHPLRSASVASFIALMQQLAAPAAVS
jgi:hypothetical protein